MSTSQQIPTVRALVIGQNKVGKSEFIKSLGNFKSFQFQDYDQCLYRAQVKARDKRLLPLVDDTLQDTHFSLSTILPSKREKLRVVFNLEIWEIPSSIIGVINDPRFLLQHIKDAHICFCLVDSTKHETSLQTMTAFRDEIMKYGGCKKLYSLIYHKFDIRKNLSRLKARRIFKENTAYFHHYNRTRKSRPSRIRKAVFKVVDHFLHAELRRLSSNECLYPWPTMKSVIVESSIQYASEDEDYDGFSILSGNDFPPISSVYQHSETMECRFANDSILHKIESINHSLEKCNNTINDIFHSQDCVMDNQLQSLQKNLINIYNESVSQLEEIQTQMPEMGEMSPAQQQEMRDRLDEIKSALTKSRLSCTQHANAIQLFRNPGNPASSLPSQDRSPGKKSFFRNIGTPPAHPEDSWKSIQSQVKKECFFEGCNQNG